MHLHYVVCACMCIDTYMTVRACVCARVCLDIYVFVYAYVCARMCVLCVLWRL